MNALAHVFMLVLELAGFVGGLVLLLRLGVI